MEKNQKGREVSGLSHSPYRQTERPNAAWAAFWMWLGALSGTSVADKIPKEVQS